MKRLILITALIFLIYEITTGAHTIQAQPFPNRPVQLIIVNVPGSLTDITGRLVAEELGKLLKTPFIPMNKPGAAGVVGTDAVAKSKKDGYTIAYTGVSALVYARILNPETVPYDIDKDIEPLGFHLFVPMAIAVKKDSPWITFRDLVDYAKKNPGAVRISTMGMGSVPHFSLEIIQSMTGAQFTHVPFKGGESVITAVLGGHVEVTFDAINKIIPHVESGKMRVLLLTNKMPEFPNIPTATELGYKQGLLSTWFALYGPSGMAEEVKKILVPAIEKAVENPEIKGKIEKMGGYIVEYKSPAEVKKLVAQEYESALAIATKVGLRKAN